MQFKTKDLLITVLPKAEIVDEQLAQFCRVYTAICLAGTGGCYASGGGCYASGGGCYASGCYASGCYASGGGCYASGCYASGCYASGCYASGCYGGTCHPTIINCYAGTLHPPCYGGSLPFVVQNVEDLTRLKAELNDTLKSLDTIQKEGLPSSIRSKSEAEAMERGLSEALEQVRAAKKKV